MVQSAGEHFDILAVYPEHPVPIDGHLVKGVRLPARGIAGKGILLAAVDGAASVLVIEIRLSIRIRAFTSDLTGKPI